MSKRFYVFDIQFYRNALMNQLWCNDYRMPFFAKEDAIKAAQRARDGAHAPATCEFEGAVQRRRKCSPDCNVSISKSPSCDALCLLPTNERAPGASSACTHSQPRIFANKYPGTCNFIVFYTRFSSDGVIQYRGKKQSTWR